MIYNDDFDGHKEVMMITIQQWDCVWCLCLRILARPCSCAQVLKPLLFSYILLLLQFFLALFYSFLIIWDNISYIQPSSLYCHHDYDYLEWGRVCQ